MALVGFGQPRDVGMTEPQADRYMRQTVWQLLSTNGRLTSAGGGGAAVALLERGACRRRLLRSRPRAHRWSGQCLCGSRSILGLIRAESWQWPRVAAPMAALGLTLGHTLFWTDLRMRADRAGDRAHRGRGRISPIPGEPTSAVEFRHPPIRGHSSADRPPTFPEESGPSA